jgi:hypothetical protein
MNQKFHIPVAARDWAFTLIAHTPRACRVNMRDDLLQSLVAQTGIAHNTTFTDALATNLKLRLDQGDQIATSATQAKGGTNGFGQ